MQTLTASEPRTDTPDAPPLEGIFARDRDAFVRYWAASAEALGRLPAKLARSAEQQTAAAALLDAARQQRTRFLATHGVTLYDALTDGRSRFRRLEDLADAAAEAVPGLVPTHAQVDAEATHPQKDKDGHEIDQGLLFHAFLADPDCGRHLCHAMLLPRPEALDLRDRLAADGRVDLGTARVERHGAVSVVWINNPRYLNAEDQGTLNEVEIAVDLAMLDPETAVGVLRGVPCDRGKYAGVPVFCTGINLTHLYQGKIPYLWYLIRDMSFINKIYRGLGTPETAPDEIAGGTSEKPWIAAVEKFAIGGGCQYLLVMDWVIAASDAYMTLPARKEGIIPGVANMRLPRFVGDRVARQAVMAERRIDCDSDVGRLICDEICAPDAVDAAIDAATAKLTNSGVVSAAANRRAFRIAQEPIDLFRSYMAVYAREQAYCHFSPALIANLERFWNAAQRKA
jgi:thioesterase DpgC